MVHPASPITHDRRSGAKTLPVPAVDERLVMPETRFEVVHGEVRYVSPADEPHGESHATLSTLLKTHAAPEFKVAVDMLTRTSAVNDFAPDASVYPAERDPKSGGRKLEELAFEVLNTSNLSEVGEKAKELRRRGVRRVFAIQIEKERVLEWNVRGSKWVELPKEGAIEDRVFAAPLRVASLLATIETDDAVAEALLQKNNRVILEKISQGRTEGLTEGRTEGRAEGRTEGRTEGRAEGRREGIARAVLAVLASRELSMTPAQKSTIETAEEAQLEKWLSKVVSCESVTALLRQKTKKKKV